MILACPYCGEILPCKYPIKNNMIDERDMNLVDEHMRTKHAQGEQK